MNKFAFCLAAIGLLALAPLHAQSNDHRGDKQDSATPDRGKEQHQDHQNSGHAPAAQPAPSGHAAIPQNHPAPAPVRQALPGRDNRDRVQQSGGMSGNAMQGRSTTQDQRTRTNQPGFAQGQKQDFSSFRRNLQAPRKFHGGTYRAPQGYSAHRWSYGERLPRGYYQRDYWITNFLLYGLFAPPSDLIWVRVGNDALLIDRDTGEIVQTRYGVFY